MFYTFVFALLFLIVALGFYVEKRNKKLRNYTLPSHHKPGEDSNYLVGDNKYTNGN
ncbi:hypothetical protein P9B03_05465 [Metasolibacillus meyeri]|uniref:Uncharacterized protein n=1 Tax=Metasolibacillus meyeri TaxID=1071052 RepID=A0AAW9NTT4_9BACL|nr:hypothetical protein [Metasolibacillus meyeri]MEC1177925.1 hypothetical protein [Metasolibacillus meyeri]